MYVIYARVIQRMNSLVDSKQLATMTRNHQHSYSRAEGRTGICHALRGIPYFVRIFLREEKKKRNFSLMNIPRVIAFNKEKHI